MWKIQLLPKCGDEAHAAQFNNDSLAPIAISKLRSRKSKRKFVAFPPRPVSIIVNTPAGLFQ